MLAMARCPGAVHTSTLPAARHLAAPAAVLAIKSKGGRGGSRIDGTPDAMLRVSISSASTKYAGTSLLWGEHVQVTSGGVCSVLSILHKGRESWHG